MTALTDEQWNELRGSFDPTYFHREDLAITGPPTSIYNCIAYALGITDRWINPPPALVDFIALFALHGLQTCPQTEGTQDGYQKNGQMTHASRLNSRWESKLGTSYRMWHARPSLTGPLSIYGSIVVSFKSSVSGRTRHFAVDPTNEEARRSVSSTLNSIIDSFPSLQDKFEFLFAMWVNTWNAPDRIACQSSADFAKGGEWEDLVALGPNIIPFVVGKLCSPENQFAVELYNQVQDDTQHKVDKTDLDLYYDLTNHAAWIINDYADLIDGFNTEASSWKAHQATTAMSSNSNDYLAHPSYTNLVRIGKTNIALIMEKYAQDQDGWWHELLFEIENGRRSGANTFQAPVLYQEWRKKFEERENAPTT